MKKHRKYLNTTGFSKAHELFENFKFKNGEIAKILRVSDSTVSAWLKFPSYEDYSNNLKQANEKQKKINHVDKTYPPVIENATIETLHRIEKLLQELVIVANKKKGLFG